MDNKKNTGYELSRNWFDFCFENPELIKPNHTAIYFFAVEHCNRLGHKEKFGFPSQMVMEAVGIKNWRTYSKALNDLVDFGFIEMIKISKNQYSSNIIAIVKNTKAHTKALDKALQKHSTKQCQSTVSINKQYNNITIEPFKEEKYFYNFSNELFNDPQWNETICRNNKIDSQKLLNYLDKFNLKLESELDKKTNKKDYASHFSRWLNIELNKNQKDEYQNKLRNAARNIGKQNSERTIKIGNPTPYKT